MASGDCHAGSGHERTWMQTQKAVVLEPCRYAIDGYLMLGVITSYPHLSRENWMGYYWKSSMEAVYQPQRDVTEQYQE
jgi:hypothetical protein